MQSAPIAVFLWTVLTSPGAAREAAVKQQTDPASGQQERIVTFAEVRATTHPPASWPTRVVLYPFHLINSGMESGLIRFEKHRMRERMNYWTETLRRHGIAAMIGGLGEGTGIGIGGTYTVGTGGKSDLRLLGRGSFTKGYQEFDIRWRNPLGKTLLVLETSYQWRPEENFYGLGMDTSEQERTKFALRQTWGGVRFEVAPKTRLRIGGEYKLAWLSNMRSPNTLYTPPDVLFPGLPGFGSYLRLQSTGAYIDADGIRSEYGLGGMLHAGASLQGGLGDSNVRYFNYEGRLEGRLPVAHDRSAFVAQGAFELNRPRGGSGPIPFYLLPHIGGSSTLRGFALDRFYGKNILLASLEYRYRIHPDFETFFFLDEGQMFNRTDELAWLNWKRNYGFGIRMLSDAGTVLRLDFGWSGEGFILHVNWGNREPRPLGGPIRYGTYRR